MSASSASARLPATSSLLIFLAYRRGSEEGDPSAKWLDGRLKEREILLDADHRAVIKTYYDQHAPGIHDWTQKWKGDLRTARALIFVASPGTAIRKPGTDWLYEEIEWWIKNRKTPPIVVLSERDEPSWIPVQFSRRWPMAQRLIWSKSASKRDQEVLLDRILEGLVLSEHGINYEEIRRLEIRNRALLILTVATLILGVLSLFFARSQQEQRRIAERNLQLSYGPSLQVALAAVKQKDTAAARSVLLGINKALRGFEWNLVRSLADQSERTWNEPQEIDDVDYSPDGSFLALALPNGKLSVRRLRSAFKPDSEFQADGGRVTAKNPDGSQWVASHLYGVRFFGPTQLATAGLDGRVRLWDLENGPTTSELSPSGGVRRTLEVSPDRHWIASGTEDGWVHVWKVEEDLLRVSQQADTAINLGREPHCLTFSPDSQQLVISGGYDGRVVAWDWQHSKKLVSLEAQTDITSLATLKDAVYGGRTDGSVVTWDLATGKDRVVLDADPDRGTITRMRASPDASFLGLAASNQIHLWNPRAGIFRTLSGAAEDIETFGFLGFMGELKLAAVAGQKVKFYDLASNPWRKNLGTVAGALMDVSADGRLVVTTSGTSGPGLIRVHDVDAQTSYDVSAPQEIYTVSMSSDGSRIAVGWADGTIRFYRTSDLTVLWSAKAVDRVDSIAISPTGDIVISGSQGFKKDSYEVWRGSDGKRISTLPRTGVVAISSNGKLAATSGYYFVRQTGDPDTPLFHLYQLPNLHHTASSPERQEGIEFLEFSPASDRLMVVSKSMELWTVASAPRLVWGMPLNGKPTCAGFSPDGTRVYACMFEGPGLDPKRWHNDFLIWNAETGDLLLRLPEDRQTTFTTAKWVKEKIFVENQGAITVLVPALEGLEDWEAADQFQSLTESVQKKTALEKERQMKR